jgi:hypothetical protein
VHENLLGQGTRVGVGLGEGLVPVDVSDVAAAAVGVGSEDDPAAGVSAFWQPARRTTRQRSGNSFFIVFS